MPIGTLLRRRGGTRHRTRFRALTLPYGTHCDVFDITLSNVPALPTALFDFTTTGGEPAMTGSKWG